jgi:3-deoxy-D-manno-octulosonic-acid transferase
MRALYSLLLYLAAPAALAYLALRGLKNRAYLRRWRERFGFFRRPSRPGGIWVHAASLGEVNAAEPLIRALAEAWPDRDLHLTTFTPTGSARVRERFGDDVFHVYSPLDLPGPVRRFFDRLRPGLAVIMETEIWPNLYHEMQRRGIPSLLANARISDHSFDRYRRFAGLTGPALAGVTRIGAQSRNDADRLRTLGAPADRLSVTGNLKFDLELPAELPADGAAIRASWGDTRPVLVAGSTHEAEEAPLFRAFTQLLADVPDALLVLVPRHPERFDRAARAAADAGLRTVRRSEQERCPAGVQCYVIDAMGELLRYYAACDVAFVGGSLEPVGGHNVLEPAALARPVVVGPHTFNFADITQSLLEAGAAVQVADSRELATLLGDLFANAEQRHRMGQAGAELVKHGQGAVNRTLALARAVITAGAG